MRISQSVEVATERPEVREQVVTPTHRLGLLQMGVAGEVRIAGGVGPPAGASVATRRRVSRSLAVASLQNSRNAVATWSFAATTRVEPRTRGAGQRSDATFDGRVDVFVGVDEFEGTCGEFAARGLEGLQHRRDLVIGEDAGATETADVRHARDDVERCQSLIETGG